MNNQINEEVLFKTTPDKLYGVLTDADQFSEMSGGAPTEIQPAEGGSFSLFGGMITGRTIELAQNQRIVQAWRAGNWEEGKYSLVSFVFEVVEEGTLLQFEHIGFPEGQGEHLTKGWTENYWNPLKNYLAK
ncbi:SRPBCC domain-containing protein [Halobacillus litoralis]|uniref:SRPBCC domain-containing protein n=1 Tax=Halobacillus litoralis TaxID=45668 RepID=UPI001CFC986C|nr:SRPBCC domain-containing protein [Halobacillus litoralis]WLR48019.1 SRPBCC domain-containing protein [Halobacillus litoralis]